MGVGRPKNKIDPIVVEELARSGAKVTEIADYLGVSRDTIHVNFPTELIKGRANLKLNLRQWQLEAARNGNATMLIWLGKQMLGQSDYQEDSSESEKKENGKVSFEDFCVKAGYPMPYPKQIEMLKFGLADDEPRLLLGARGYGKSDYVTIMGVAYDVYLNGHKTSNLIISKSKTRNTSMIQEIANALKANGIELDKENASCIRVRGLVGKEHSVEVLTIKSSFRGRHPKRIVMDDPVTEEDTSEAMRLLVKKKYDEAYKLCKNIVIIGQPAHQYDLYAELRPSLKLLEIPHGQIPELDADLELMKLAGIDERSIEMSYHLRIPKDGASPFENIKFLDKYPDGGQSVAFVDPSFEGGDYTAMCILKAHFDGVAVVGFAWKKAWNYCLDDIAAMSKKYNVARLCFETNSLGDQPLTILRQTIGSGVVGRKSSTNKHSRIMNAGAYSHMIHMSKESNRAFQDQVVKYEYKAKNDDAPDSLASCLHWVGLIKGRE
jgi:hypothetical protein